MKLDTKQLKKRILLYLPYVLIGLFATKLGQVWRYAPGVELGEKIRGIVTGLGLALQSPLPSFMPIDLCIGIVCGVLVRLYVVSKAKNAKKYKDSIYTFFHQDQLPKEKADYLKKRYGVGGSNSALPGSFRSWRNYDGKGLSLKKPDCPDVVMNWNTVVKHIESLMCAGRYISPDEQDMLGKFIAMYDSVGGLPPLKIGERLPSPELVAEEMATCRAVAELKQEHPNDLILYQRNFDFELYGTDVAFAREIDTYLHSYHRFLPVTGDVEIANISDFRCESFVQKALKCCGVTVSSLDKESKERKLLTFPQGTENADINKQLEIAQIPDSAESEKLQQAEVDENNAATVVAAESVERKPRWYLVSVYHHFENGFDAKMRLSILPKR